MSHATRSMSNPAILAAHQPLAVRIAEAVCALSLEQLPDAAARKAKLCLIDLIGCAFESRQLPWSRQAVALAAPLDEGASIIGHRSAVAHADAAFANAVMGHGLVREDMHSGSISHLGIVVLPALLALAQYRRVRGRDWLAAVIAGYEAGGRVGRAVMDAEVARIHRPTGITGPVAAAAAGARALGLDLEATTSAIALGANCAMGYNQWAHTGGSEMYFHAGFAARNALAAVRLAEQGAFASPSALDGEAGLFAALKKRSAAAKLEMFHGDPEILSVYHKPVPACNFAQTASQAALRIARDKAIAPEGIAGVAVRVPRAGALYPGCDFTGPFAHVLQAKMSIQYNVAAALLAGSVSEKNFERLQDSRLHRLIGVMSLQVDDEMTAAYPGKQGGEVEVHEAGGAVHRVRLDDVVNASEEDVRARFRAAAAEVCGSPRAGEIERAIDGLERSDDVGQFVRLLQAD